MLYVIALFVVLLVAGVALGELEWRALLGFIVAAGLVVGIIVLFGLPFIWITAGFALLDIALVFKVFQGNLQL